MFAGRGELRRCGSDRGTVRQLPVDRRPVRALRSAQGLVRRRAGSVARPGPPIRSRDVYPARGRPAPGRLVRFQGDAVARVNRRRPRGQLTGRRPDLVELGEAAAGPQRERQARRQVQLREHAAADGRPADVSRGRPDEHLGDRHSAVAERAQVDPPPANGNACSSRPSACRGTSPPVAAPPARPRGRCWREARAPG